MIFDHLIPQLQEHFGNRNFTIDASKNQIIFPAAHPAVGDLDIRDDGDEITIIAGKFTHGHFSSYDGRLSEDEQQKRIAEDVITFLKKVFADQIVFWGSHQGSGGWYRRGQPPEWAKTGLLKKTEEEFVWSGPLQ